MLVDWIWDFRKYDYIFLEDLVIILKLRIIFELLDCFEINLVDYFDYEDVE